MQFALHSHDSDQAKRACPEMTEKDTLGCFLVRGESGATHTT
jgi:hypothetical protein